MEAAAERVESVAGPTAAPGVWGVGELCSVAGVVQAMEPGARLHLGVGQVRGSHRLRKAAVRRAVG